MNQDIVCVKKFAIYNTFGVMSSSLLYHLCQLRPDKDQSAQHLKCFGNNKKKAHSIRPNINNVNNISASSDKNDDNTSSDRNNDNALSDKNIMSHQTEIMYTFSNYIYHMADHTTILCKNNFFFFFQIIPFQGEFRVCN